VKHPFDLRLCRCLKCGLIVLWVGVSMVGWPQTPGWAEESKKVLLRYRYAPKRTLQLTGKMTLKQTYRVIGDARPAQVEKNFDIKGEMSFHRVAKDGTRALVESRVESMTKGETRAGYSTQWLEYVCEFRCQL